MPVTSISISVLWSTKGGASRWIARVEFVSGVSFQFLRGKLERVCNKRVSLPIGPHSSMGSPITFMIRPRVARPTGICKTKQIGFYCLLRRKIEMKQSGPEWDFRCWQPLAHERAPPWCPSQSSEPCSRQGAGQLPIPGGPSGGER